MDERFRGFVMMRELMVTAMEGEVSTRRAWGGGRMSQEEQDRRRHTAILVFEIQRRPVVGPAADDTHGERIRLGEASRSRGERSRRVEAREPGRSNGRCGRDVCEMASWKASDDCEWTWE